MAANGLLVVRFASCLKDQIYRGADRPQGQSVSTTYYVSTV